MGDKYDSIIIFTWFDVKLPEDLFIYTEQANNIFEKYSWKIKF